MGISERESQSQVDFDSINSRGDLEHAIYECDSAIASIELQLAKARDRLRDSGKYSDALWYRNATFAKKGLQRDRGLLQNMYPSFTQHASTRVSDAFVVIAKRRLTSELYGEILQEANDKHE